MNRLWSRTAAIEIPLDLTWYADRWPWFAGAAGLLLAYLLGRTARPRAEDPPSTPGTDGQLAALGERLTSMGQQQENLARTLRALEGVLGHNQARGAFGEVQLERLVADLLPAAAYRLRAPIGRNRVDCLIGLPWPPGPVPVDAKFPLEAFRAWQDAGDAAGAAKALRRLERDFGVHVEAIRSKYLAPGTTADFALLFLPSEAVFAALHTHCRQAIEAAHHARVFPVSPSTLWPLLNTLAAVLRDVSFAEGTHRMQAEAAQLAADSAALADLARRTERDWSRLAADLQALIAAADALAASGRRFGRKPGPGN